MELLQRVNKLASRYRCQPNSRYWMIVVLLLLIHNSADADKTENREESNRSKPYNNNSSDSSDSVKEMIIIVQDETLNKLQNDLLTNANNLIDKNTIRIDSNDEIIQTANAGSNYRAVETEPAAAAASASAADGAADEDDKKTLSQQVADGKYGLIQQELFSDSQGNKARKPGILSYDVNPEVPKDNINSLGGLEPEDIWLAENHLLVLAGSKFRGSSSPWVPIDNYIAPKRPVKIPENPKVPPPFPVQLNENGPIEYLKGENGSTASPPIIPFFLMFPPQNNKLSPFSPFGASPPGLNFSQPPTPFIKPLYAPVIANTNDSFPPAGPPPFYKPPAGAEFLPAPFLGNLSDNFDEDDPSLYYPPPYDFYYSSGQQQDSKVPAGPLVPGIVLPPPPDFFALLKNKSANAKPSKLPGPGKSSVVSGKVPFYGDKSYPVRSKVGKSSKAVQTNEFTTTPATAVITYKDVSGDVTYPEIGGNKITYNDITGKSGDDEDWVPIPAPKPYYVSGEELGKPIKDDSVTYDSGNSREANNYQYTTTSRTPFSVTSAKTYHPPVQQSPPRHSVQTTYYFYEEPKYTVANFPNKAPDNSATSDFLNDNRNSAAIGGASTSTSTASPKISINNLKGVGRKNKNKSSYNQRQPKAPIIPIYYLAELNNFVEDNAGNNNNDNDKPAVLIRPKPPTKNSPYNNAVTTVKPTYSLHEPVNNNFLQPTARPIFEYSYTASGYDAGKTDNKHLSYDFRPTEYPPSDQGYRIKIAPPSEIEQHGYIKNPSPSQSYRNDNKQSFRQPSYDHQNYYYQQRPYNDHLYQQQQQQPVAPLPQHFLYRLQLPWANSYENTVNAQPAAWYHQRALAENKPNVNLNDNNNPYYYNFPDDHAWSGKYHENRQPFAKEFYRQTENPFYAFFTKEDEDLIDENTKKYFTIFGKKIKNSAMSENTTPLSRWKDAEQQWIDSTTTATTSKPDEHESSTLSLEGDTLVNYINPPVTVEPDAEFVNVDKKTPNRANNYLVNYRSLSNEDDNSPARTANYGYSNGNENSEESGEEEPTSPIIRPLSLKDDTAVNYKRHKRPLNSNAEYIRQSTTAESSPLSTNQIANTRKNKNSFIRQRRPISLENDVAVNYKHPRPAINPDAEYISFADGHAKQPTYRQNLAATSQRIVSYRMPNGSGHLFFITPKEVYKLDELNAPRSPSAVGSGQNSHADSFESVVPGADTFNDFRSADNSEKNYLKRMLPSPAVTTVDSRTENENSTIKQ